MTVRWVVTEKHINGQPVVKARLVVHGFQETHDFREDCPTSTRESIHLALSVIASKAWTSQALDIKTAFLQGQTINHIVSVLPPPEAETECLYLCLCDVLSKRHVLPSPLDETQMT